MIVSVSAPAFAATTDLTDVTGLSFEYVGSVNKYTDKMLTDKQPKYLFKIDSTVTTADGKSDGKTYILLNRSNASADDGYFVMVQEGALSTQNASSATAQLRSGYPGTSSNQNDKAPTAVFDTEKEDSIAYYLNSDSYISTQFPVMSAGNYIKEHTWYTESSGKDTDTTTKKPPYSSAAKIALPSVTEYAANLDRIGILSDGYTTVSFLTRTAHRDGGNAKYNNNTYTTPAIWSVSSSKSLGVSAIVATYNSVERPCFYLDEDFFKNVKLDMTLLKTDGSAAAEVLKNIADKKGGLDALKQIYKAEELAEIGISGSVKITNATLTGTGNCGDTLVATAETNLPEGNEPAYEWVRVNADNTTTTLDCTANSYTVKFDDLGASIKCLIKVFDGETLSDSKYTNAITTEAKPTFETCASLKITADNSQGVKTTPEAYKFSFDGSEFVLLKSVNANENDGQFVATVSNIINDVNKADLNWYATDILALKKFVYDPNNTDSIANKINNEDFWNEKTVSNTTLIPNDMRSYLEKHRWWNEQINTTDVYSQEAFATESKVALLSYTEYVRNINRIGYNDTNSTRGILTRSAFYKTSGGYTLENPNIITISANEDTGKYRISNLTTTSGDGKKGLIGYYQNKKIAFYLDPSFFAEQKVDFTSANTEVIAVLKEALKGKSAGELVGMGYTTEQIGLISDAKIGKVAMYGFTKGENGTITFTCKNMTSDDVSFIPAAAAYDNGAMISVYFANSAVEIPAGETKEVTVTLSTSGNAQIKVFAWDKTNLTPYAPVAEVK